MKRHVAAVTQSLQSHWNGIHGGKALEKIRLKRIGLFLNFLCNSTTGGRGLVWDSCTIGGCDVTKPRGKAFDGMADRKNKMSCLQIALGRFQIQVMMKASGEARQGGFAGNFSFGSKPSLVQSLPTFLFGAFIAEKLTMQAQSTTHRFAARLADMRQKDAGLGMRCRRRR